MTFDTIVPAEADLVSLVAAGVMMLGGVVGLVGLAGAVAISLMPPRRTIRR